MVTYKFNITVNIDADNIDDAQEVLDYMEDSTNGVSFSFVAPHADNPDDYPENDDE